MAFRRIDAAVLADLFSRAAELRAGRTAGEAPRPERSRALIEDLFARARALRDASDEARVLDPGESAEGSEVGEVGVDGAATDPPTELSTRPRPARPPRMDHGAAVEEFRRTLEALFEGSGEGDLEALASASGVLEAVAVPKPGPEPEPRPPTASEPPARPGPLPTREKLFSAAAEAIFGDRLEELERLVLATLSGPPPTTATTGPTVGARAAAATATPPPSPELQAVEPGDPLLPVAEPRPARWMSESSVDGLLSRFELPGSSAPAPPPAEPVDERITESAVDGVLAGFHFDGGNPVPAALAGPRLPSPAAAPPAQDEYAARAVEAAPPAAGPGPPSGSGSWGGDSGTGSTVGFDPLRPYAKGTAAKGAPAPPTSSPAAALDLGASFDGFGWPGGVPPASPASATPAPVARTGVPTRLVIPVPSDVEDAPEPVRPTRPLGRPVLGASASATIGFDGVLPAGPAHGTPTIGFDGVLPAGATRVPGASASATIGFDGVLPAGPAPGPGATIGFEGVLPAPARAASPGGPGSGSHRRPDFGKTIAYDGVIPGVQVPGPGATIGFEGVLPAPAPAAPPAGSGSHRRPGFAKTVAFDDVLPPPVVTPPLPARSNAPWLLASGTQRAVPDASPTSATPTIGFDGVLGAPPPPARPPEARPGRPEVLTTSAAVSARGPRGAGPGPLADFLRALPPGADPLAPAQGPPPGKRPTPGAGVPIVRPPPPANDPFANDPFAAPAAPGARPGAPAVIGGPWPTPGPAPGAGAWPTPPTAAWPAPGDPFAPRPAQPPGAFVDPFRRDPAASDRPTVYPEEPTAWGQAVRPPGGPPPQPPPARVVASSGGWNALPGAPPPNRSGGSGAFAALPQQPPQPPPKRSGGSGAWGTLGAQAQQPPAPPPKAPPKGSKLLPPGPAPGAPGLRASGEGFDPTAPSWWDGQEPPPG